ncbi:hypothetical protein REPUB_Repub12eG0046700 [Reevesia pubescens]
MADNIEKLSSKLSLTEDEQQEILVEKGWHVETLVNVLNCLLGKKLANKGVSVEVLQGVFKKFWRLSHGVQIKDLGEKRFFFHFSSQADKDRVFAFQPWSFNRAMVILNEFDGLVSADKVVMVLVPILGANPWASDWDDE